MSIFNIFTHKGQTCKICPYILTFAAKSHRDATYKRRYRNLEHHLEGYEKSIGTELTSENFNFQMMEGFESYLKDRGMRKNSIKSMFCNIHLIIKKIKNDGFSVDRSIDDYHVKGEDVTSVYLTMEEIKSVYEYNPRQHGSRVIKDLFVVGCLTGMRYSDYSRLTSQNIIGNLIVRKTQKTGATVSVPIHHIVKEIIDKYEGFPIYKDSPQNFNKCIKNICKHVGLNEKFLVEYTQGNKVIRKNMKKWELVGTHTARRSFATNAYISGIPTARIMLMTGHKTESAFFKYIRIEKKENAILLSNHPFFAE